MHRLIGALALLATSATLHATDVVDDFESGTNPNQWGWTNNNGGVFTIVADGGNPGAWLDSGVPYRSDHPNLTSLPPAGTPLRETAREVVQRLRRGVVAYSSLADDEE